MITKMTAKTVVRIKRQMMLIAIQKIKLLNLVQKAKIVTNNKEITERSAKALFSCWWK